MMHSYMSYIEICQEVFPGKIARELMAINVEWV